MKTLSGLKVFLLFVSIAITMTSCELAGDIFQAGMWIGIIIVVAIIALVLWLLRKMRR